MKTAYYLLFPFLLFFLACGEDSNGGGSDDEDSIEIIDEIVEGDYSQQHRPQFHFSPPSQWMNDPNGMFFYKGEYHLFYQHFPDSNVWGPMHWGHAVSEDMVHWTNLPIAIYPDSLGWIFSGSAVVDKDNTSGFKDGPEAPIVAIFTHHNSKLEKAGSDKHQYQSIAYSNDRGRSWTLYEGNPVVENPGIRDFRDPKVFWHKASKKWVMILASLDRVRIYNSPDLKSWEETSEFGAEYGSHAGVWECPDLFEMDVDGNPGDKKYMMIVSIGSGGPNGGSATQYFVGDFDGKEFTLDPETKKALGKKAAYVPEGVVFEDFEERRYAEGWTTEGKAFQKGGQKGTMKRQRDVVGFTGKRLVNSFHKGDASTGKLISPKFTIEKGYINFQIGGGNNPGLTCMNLFVNGAIVASSTGNDSEGLIWKSWDVRDYVGSEGQLVMVDDKTDGWGHILVDQIQFSNESTKPVREDALWLDYGKDNYAGVTWSDIPRIDGRRLFMGWMSNWQYATVVPTYEWRSAMTLPRELELIRTSKGIRCVTHPVTELKELRMEEAEESMNVLSLVEATNDQQLLTELKVDSPLVEMNITLTVDEGATGGLRLISKSTSDVLEIGYDRVKSRFYVDRRKAGKVDFSNKFARNIHYAPLSTENGSVDLTIYLDVSSIEIFGDNGELVMTEIFFPTKDFDQVYVFGRRGKTSVEGEKFRLLPIW
ncbi:MAG: glycoside hydrolase family 32 protein [Bacteroidota bacterium]